MRVPLLGAVLLSVVVASAMPAQSAEAKREYDAGKKAWDDNKCPEAVAAFERALRAHPQYSDAMYYMGDCLRILERWDDAIANFVRLEQTAPNYGKYYFYLWGLALEGKGELAQAADRYRQFQASYAEAPNRAVAHARARARLRYVTESPAVRARPSVTEPPANMGAGVNSRWEDYTPNSDPTGRIIYFTSQRKGGYDSPTGNDASGYGSNIWRVSRSSTGWGVPEVLPEPINTAAGNEGTASFSGDGQTMVYAGCGRPGGIGSCDIYIANLEGSNWTAPRNLGNVVNSAEWDSQPSLSADGNILIFVSTRPGGVGGMDLYIARKDRDGEWTVPVNLGPTINTPSPEASPNLSPDGRTLYFASEGHPGLGGNDLFVTVWESGEWSTPLNLGAPINSPGDDRYFTIGGSGEAGYFASNRAGGLGDYDLYQVALPEALRPKPTAVVAGTVTNERTKAPLGAVVIVEDISTGELIATHKSNSVTGKYLVVLPAGRDYSVSASSNGYFFYSQRFTLAADARYQEVTRDIALSPIEKGTKVVLNNVFFETGRATLTPESRVELRKVVDLLTGNPRIIIEVGGHTDNTGNADANLRLSHQRAQAVREFLVAQGVPAAQVQAKGYGQASPVASNDTAEGRQANRRTEMIIIDG